jgi:hypothetical protein
MISNKIYLVSSGFPNKKEKYFSPYIKTYYEELSKEYKVVIIAPFFKGILGLFTTNFICIIRFLTDFILGNKKSIWFIHSTIHALIIPYLVNPKKLIINFHGVELFKESKLFDLLIKLFLFPVKSETKIIFPSYSFKKQLNEKFKNKLGSNECLINYSLGIEIQREKINIVYNDIKVFYPGNTTYLKGYDYFKEFIMKHPKVKFYCFPNVYKTLKDYHKNIYEQPFYDDKNKYKVLSQFKFLFHPSRFESVSLILLEAYSIGIKCIVHRLPAFIELSENLKDFIWLDIEKINFNSKYKTNCSLDISRYDRNILVKKTLNFINDRNI